MKCSAGVLCRMHSAAPRGRRSFMEAYKFIGERRLLCDRLRQRRRVRRGNVVGQRGRLCEECEIELRPADWPRDRLWPHKCTHVAPGRFDGVLFILIILYFFSIYNIWDFFFLLLLLLIDGILAISDVTCVMQTAQRKANKNVTKIMRK